MSEYKVGVAIMLRDGLGPALSAISHQLLGVHKSVGDIENGMNRWKTAILGAGAVLAGSMLIKGMVKLVDHAKEYEHEMAKARALGLSVSDMEKVRSQAWKNTDDVSGTSAAGAVKTIGSLYSIVGLEEALKLSQNFEKSDRVLGALGKGEEGSAYTIARAGELMGKFTDAAGHLDVAKFSAFLDTINRAVISTHGMVSAKEWLNYAKQSGPASANLTEDGMLTTSAMIQAMGGHRAGTAGAALARQFAGGIMSQRVAKELERLGIAQQGDFEVARGGQVIAKTGAMAPMVEALGKDPLEAIVDHIMPALEAKGLTGSKMAAEIYRMIGTGPAQREVYELLRGVYQIKSERDRAKGAMGTGEAYQNFAEHDPKTVQKNAGVAYDNMLTAIGDGAVMAAIPGMLAVTNLFKSIAGIATANPTGMLVIVSVITAVGAALVTLGAALLAIAAGPTALIVAAVVGAIAGIGVALAMVPWASVGAWISGAVKATGDGIMAFVNHVTEIGASIGKLVGSWVDSGTAFAKTVKGWLDSAVAAVNSGVESALKGVVDVVGHAFKSVADAASVVLGPLSSLAGAISKLGSWFGFGGGAKPGAGGAAPEGGPAAGPSVHGALTTPNGGRQYSSLAPSLTMPNGGRQYSSLAPSLTQRQTYNAVPPPPSSGAGQGVGSIYMDGRKVGEVVSHHQSVAANGPLQGSAYYDGSATFVPADYAFARG